MRIRDLVSPLKIKTGPDAFFRLVPLGFSGRVQGIVPVLRTFPPSQESIKRSQAGLALISQTVD